MKKSVFLILILLMVTYPVLAQDGEHSGDVGTIVAEALLIPSVAYVVMASFLTILIVAITYIIGKEPLSKWQYGILAFGTFSGFIHLVLGIDGDILLLLNGLGYLILLAALFLPKGYLVEKRQLSLWLLLGYTIITFIGYFMLHPSGGYHALGLLTKAVELGLMICLVMRIREKSKKHAGKSLTTMVQIQSEVRSD